METKQVIFELRTKKGLSQEELAKRIMVSRQAVSRWETGETIPNTETLKLLSKEFNVSINTLLGAPKALVCQCCGMPMEDEIVGRNADGFLNEDYCKWCYADGSFTYDNMDELLEVCVAQMQKQGFEQEQARELMRATLPELKYWKQHDELSDGGRFEALKKQLVEEFNALGIKGMPKLEGLNALVGAYVNLEYPLPGGQIARFLDDQTTYLGNQLESELGDGRCFGVLANAEFIMVCSYGAEGADPELLLYKRR